MLVAMKPIKHGLYIAMAEEARVIAKTLNFVQCKREVWPYSESFFHEQWNALIVTGGQTDFQNCKISRVGKAAAAQMTALLIARLSPQWIWNVGTCGGITDFGAQIGDVYTGHVQQHDMHTPQDLIKQYVYRTLHTQDVRALMQHNTNFKVGLISTGDAFDKSERDWQHIKNTKTNVVDMEAFAVADVVCNLMTKRLNNTLPLILLKGVTDTITLSEMHVDSIHIAAKDFSQNLKSAMQNVATAVRQVFKNGILDEALPL